MEQTAPAIGDNRPPEEITIRDRLIEQYEPMTKRRDELLAGAKRVPEEIEDEETAKKVGDFVKQLTAAHKNAEATRVDEKEPFLAAERGVDGFFKGITGPLAATKKAIVARLTNYQRKKEAEERRRREKAEREAREEAERLARAAADAVRLEEEARQRQREAEDAEVRGAVQDTIDAEDRAKAALDAARAAEQVLGSATKAAAVKPAELSRTRAEYGSVSSLQAKWTGELADRETLNLNALRHHFTDDALNSAIRSYVQALGSNPKGKTLKGARIYEKTETHVR